MLTCVPQRTSTHSTTEMGPLPPPSPDGWVRALPKCQPGTLCQAFYKGQLWSAISSSQQSVTVVPKLDRTWEAFKHFITQVTPKTNHSIWAVGVGIHVSKDSQVIPTRSKVSETPRDGNRYGSSVRGSSKILMLELKPRGDGVKR